MFRVIGVDAIAFDGRVVGFSLVLALVATVLFGALPALRGTKTDIVSGLRRDDSARRTVWRKGRMRRALVVSQVVLCVVTMIVTTLVFRSFLQVARSAADPGFDTRGLLIASLAPPATAVDPMVVATRTEEAKRRIAGIAGVERVALVSQVPFLQGGSPKDLFRRAAGTEDRQGDKVPADVRLVDADFFAVVSMPLVRGRTFTGHDDRTSLPVIIVSDRLASAAWRDAEAVGDRLLVDGVWRTVVGVVRSTIAPSPFRPASREAFIPYAQAVPANLEMLIRSSLPAASLMSQVRGQVQAIDRDQPVTVRTMQDALDEMMTPFRLILVLMAVFATIALALPAVGLYGVITHDVSRRKQEIGIRMAIGARRSEIIGMVMRQGLRLAGWGVAFGLLLGLAAAKIVPAALFGTGGLSLFHYVAIALTWLAIAVAACLVPARRAARLDPVSALRCE